MDTSLESDHITHPLRMAKGSHQPGTGEGCAMNVVSYINGDEQITDFPAGSAAPLAVLVQATNDLLAGRDGYLSPESGVLALELAWQTSGTADVPHTAVHAWLAELLTNPQWGVIQYAGITAIKAIRDIAALHRAAGAGSVSPIAQWDAAECAARAISTTGHRAGGHALQAAVQSAMGVANQATINEVTAHAVQAHALAAGDDAARRVVGVSRQAIRLWRDVAGSDIERHAGVRPGSDRVPAAAAA